MHRFDSHSSSRVQYEAWKGSSITCAGSVSVGADLSVWQLAEQPSFGSVLPSSQSSRGVSRMLSPHRESVQSGRQGALGRSELRAPVSHCSDVSSRALPQKEGRAASSSGVRHDPCTQRSLRLQSASMRQASSGAMGVQRPLMHCSPEGHCALDVQDRSEQNPLMQLWPDGQSRLESQLSCGFAEDTDDACAS
jgi:hypothetical protein